MPSWTSNVAPGWSVPAVVDQMNGVAVPPIDQSSG